MVDEAEVPYVDFSKVVNREYGDQFFGLIVHDFNGRQPSNKKENVKLEQPIPSFSTNVTRLLYNRKVYVLRKAVSYMLQSAHDSETAFYFKFAKTMSRLSSFRWTHKARDVKSDIDECEVSATLSF